MLLGPTVVVVSLFCKSVERVYSASRLARFPEPGVQSCFHCVGFVIGKFEVPTDLKILDVETEIRLD